MAWWRSARQHRFTTRRTTTRTKPRNVFSIDVSRNEIVRWYRAMVKSILFLHTRGFIALRYDDVPTRNAALRVATRVGFCASVRMSCVRSELSGQSHLVGFYAIMNIAVQMMERAFFSFRPEKSRWNLRANGITIDVLVTSVSLQARITPIENYS